MPVDDRLRRGLDANARAFVPEGEERLLQVHRRRRTRTRVLAATAAATVAALAAVSGSLLGGSERTGQSEPAPQPTQESTSTNVYSGPRIPDSNWRKVVTRAQLVRAGADSAFLAENLGRADRLPLTLSFVGKVYTQSGRYLGSWSVGDAGTLAYDSDGRLVLTSTSPGCRGCTATFTWRIRGDRLELDVPGAGLGDPVAGVIMQGVWTRQRT